MAIYPVRLTRGPWYRAVPRGPPVNTFRPSEHAGYRPRKTQASRRCGRSCIARMAPTAASETCEGGDTVKSIVYISSSHFFPRAFSRRDSERDGGRANKSRAVPNFHLDPTMRKCPTYTRTATCEVPSVREPGNVKFDVTVIISRGARLISRSIDNAPRPRQFSILRDIVRTRSRNSRVREKASRH